MKKLPETLPDDIDKLKAIIHHLTQQYQSLLEMFRKAQHERYCPRTEVHPEQGCLFNEAEQEAQPDAPEPETTPDTPVVAHQRRGRRPLSPALPRETIEHALPPEQQVCPCCQGALHTLGEVVTEQLDIIPKQVKVLRHVRYKYACRHCEQQGTGSPVVTAPAPAAPLPGSVASPSTLAVVITAKYADGLPLYRMEQELQRSGLQISRTTLANWIIRSAQWLTPVYQALRATLLAEPLLHGDETTLQVLKEPGKTAQSTSYMWAYCSSEHSRTPVVLFDYQPGRGHLYPMAFLDGWQGTLMSDGYSAWRQVPAANHLGCWSHARRKFHDALKIQPKKTGKAQMALGLIQKLYAVESRIRERPVAERYRIRQSQSVPILAALHDWLQASAQQVLPETLLGKAVHYTLKQWPYLVRYVEDGHFPIDNNRIERDIRPLATGRKAWLFADTVNGANASALMYSLLLTCRANGVEPYAWLRDLFSELPQREAGADISDLLPFNYRTR